MDGENGKIGAAYAAITASDQGGCETFDGDFGDGGPAVTMEEFAAWARKAPRYLEFLRRLEQSGLVAALGAELIAGKATGEANSPGGLAAKLGPSQTEALLNLGPTGQRNRDAK